MHAAWTSALPRSRGGGGGTRGKRARANRSRPILVGLCAVLLSGPPGATSEAVRLASTLRPESTLRPGPAMRLESTVRGPSVPLLLVPGWFDTERDLAAMRIRFVAAGWASDHVDALTFEDPTGGNRAHALQIDSAVSELLERTGAEVVDIVAHSMGGLATRWYLRTHPGAPVRRIAFLASPHQGTLSAHFAWGDGRDDMLPESPFLDSLNAGTPLPEGVEAITVRTLLDTHVIPPESATLPGVQDHLICCPTHDGLLRDLEVFRIVHDFLEAPTAAAPTLRRQPARGAPRPAPAGGERAGRSLSLRR